VPAFRELLAGLGDLGVESPGAPLVPLGAEGGGPARAHGLRAVARAEGTHLEVVGQHRTTHGRELLVYSVGPLLENDPMAWARLHRVRELTLERAEPGPRL